MPRHGSKYPHRHECLGQTNLGVDSECVRERRIDRNALFLAFLYLKNCIQLSNHSCFIIITVYCCNDSQSQYSTLLVHIVGQTEVRALPLGVAAERSDLY